MEFQESIPENALLGVSEERCEKEEPSAVGTVNETLSAAGFRDMAILNVCVVLLSFF